MAPPAAALIHLPAEELHPGCLQLPHGAGEIVDDEADDGTGGEVLMVLVAWAEHLERAPLRELEGGEVGPLLDRRRYARSSAAPARMRECPDQRDRDTIGIGCDTPCHLWGAESGFVP
jgi:hypothetical protein